MRIGIAGINGRIGRLLAEEVRTMGAELVGGTTRLPRPSADASRPEFDQIEALAARAQVVIDFTHADAVPRHAAALEQAGTAWVLGTTGLSVLAQDAVMAASRRIAVVQAANFSPGVAVMLDLAQRLGAALPAERYDAEILEMHHRGKRDAPSGTALAIGHAIAVGRGGEPPPLEGGRHRSTGPRQTSPRQPGAIGYATLRGGDIVGEHTLLLTAAGEQISLGHRAFDRRLFAAGAVRAALWTEARAPGLYGMADVLALSP